MPRYQKANSEANALMLRSIPGMEKMVCIITQRITESADSSDQMIRFWPKDFRVLATISDDKSSTRFLRGLH